MPIPDERDSRAAGEWGASHPFLLFGLGSLAFVMLAAYLEVGADTPAAAVVRAIIWPLYSGASLGLLIAKLVLGSNLDSALGVFVVRFLMIPLSMAPYLVLDWLLGKVRRRRAVKHPAAPIFPR